MLRSFDQLQRGSCIEIKMNKLVGLRLTKPGGSMLARDFLTKHRYTLFYVAHDDFGDCKIFDGRLKQFYNLVNNPNHILEICTVCRQEERHKHNAYIQSLPWYAIPYEEFGIGIFFVQELFAWHYPTLALVSKGKLVLDNCVQILQQHESHEDVLKRFDREIEEIEDPKRYKVPGL